MGLKNKKKIIAIILIVVIVIISGITYGYWNKEYIGKENTNNFNCLQIEVKENKEGITLNNAYPITDEEGIETEGYEVTIENKCEIVGNYEVILNEIQGSNLKEEHIKVAVDKNYQILSKYEKVNPRIENSEKAYKIKEGIITPKAKIKILVQEWIDYDTTKEEGENKTFNNKITIEGTTKINDKLLAGKIIKENKVIEEEPDFSKGEPLGEDCSQNITEDKTVSLLSTNSYFIGDSFEYSNNDNGQYTIKNNGVKVDNYITSNFTDNDIDKYICMSRYNVCATMYKIKEISEDKTKVIKADEYTSTCKSKAQGSGLYKTEDDQGGSYYFRGDRKLLNNNVEFAGKKWKIIRVNGDGTVRLILADNNWRIKSIGQSTFNNYNNYNETTGRYTGFTYNNQSGKECTQEQPCEVRYNNGNFSNESFEGTNSDIKTYLEKWYSENLKEEDKYISYSYFCNDSSYASGDENQYSYYGAYIRIRDRYQPSLKCPEPNNQSGEPRDYGGIYKTKIGLITADEMNLGGITYSNERIGLTSTGDNYLYFSDKWWSMSPHNSYKSSHVFFKGESINSNSNANSEHNVMPVINLSTNTLMSTGDGSESNPFVIN